MAKFFVSYARIDIVLAEQIIDILRQRYGHADVWYDQELHNRGGEYWWEEILDAIGQADIFIYLLSKESVESPYCQAEFEEAQRLKKRLIFIQVRDRTPLPSAIASRQYADMSKGIGSLKTWTSLYNSIDYQIRQIPKRRPRPLRPERTPRPQQAESSEARPADSPAETTPKLEPVMLDEVNDHTTPPRLTRLQYVAIVTGVLVVGMLIIGLLITSSGGGADTSTLTDDETSVVIVDTETSTDEPTPDISEDDARATGAAQAYATLTALAPTDTPTISPTPTNTPISSSDIQQTTQAEFFSTGTIAAQTEVVSAQETQNAVLTEQFSAGSTATHIAQLSLTPPATSTPTPSYTPTATNTSRPTNTPQPTATNTSRPTNTPRPTTTNTPRPTATNTPRSTSTPNAVQAAFMPVTRNADWTPVERDFDGVTMVLVPSGCFMMGSTNEQAIHASSLTSTSQRYMDLFRSEQPAHEQCFDNPFWIDKHEVTNSQYGSTGCTEWSSEPDQPRNCINWFDAHDYCTSRNASLPTEAEWEYVARGPDSLIYPWGDTYNAGNLISVDDPTYGNNRTAPVGSRPSGASWVGAFDMSGNLNEWISSLYQPYPYSSSDGRESTTRTSIDVVRVVRGGSYDLGLGWQRASTRNYNNPNTEDRYLGFRCLREFTSESSN